jgi:integrase
MSRGKVRQFTWTYEGQTKKAWGYTVTVEGKRVRRAGFGSRAEATEALDLLLHPAPVAALPPVVEVLTLKVAFTRYEMEKARKRSLVADQRNAKCLMAVFGEDTPLHEITASKISAYRASRIALPITPAAVNRPLALLRHLLRLAAEEWEVIPEAPRVRLEKESQGRLRWLTPEEAHQLLDACRAHQGAPLAGLVELCLCTGLRQGEALRLTWDRVDRSRGVLLLEITKSGRRREVPLCGPADAVLAHLAGPGTPAGLVFGTSSWTMFRKAWEKALEAARLHGLHFHDLRHTFASWAVQLGATLPELKDLLGHATLAMVMRYAHLSPEHLRSAVGRLDTVMATGTGRNRAEEMVDSAPRLVSATRAVSSVGRAADS